MQIPLTSSKYRVTKINRKTKAKMFKNIELGDVLIFTCILERLGTTRGNTYAPHVKIENISKKESVHKSFNELGNIMDAFEMTDQILR